MLENLTQTLNRQRLRVGGTHSKDSERSRVKDDVKTKLHFHILRTKMEEKKKNTCNVAVVVLELSR